MPGQFNLTTCVGGSPERAKNLLRDVCTQSQWDYFLKYQQIIAVGKSGITYTITLRGDIRSNWGSYCVVFKDTYEVLPHDYKEPDVLAYHLDTMVARKLMVECCESDFRRLAHLV